jgi:hypothetical protein
MTGIRILARMLLEKGINRVRMDQETKNDYTLQNGLDKSPERLPEHHPVRRQVFVHQLKF